MNAADVAQTLKESGQPMTLTRTGAGTFDPVSGATTGGIVQTWTVYGITKAYKLSSINASGSLILAGDKEALIEATVKPLTGDTLTIMGEIWTVISINELSPQGVALMYTCQVRK